MFCEEKLLQYDTVVLCHMWRLSEYVLHCVHEKTIALDNVR